MVHLRSLSALTFLSAGLFTATTALAVDGVLELNQTCAISTGCTRGDDPGFPISIDGGDGRSYRLTSDLLIGDANTTGIVIDENADGVSLDLNGFSIRGVTSCTGNGQTISCSPTGPGGGIRSDAQRTHVHDGHIVGMGFTGIDVDAGSLIERVTVSESGGYAGFVLGPNTVVSHSTSSRNSRQGFFISHGSVVNNCTSERNGGDGYFVSSGVQAHQNSALNNGWSGFRALGTPAANLQGNTAYFNGEHGINVGDRSTIRNNSLKDNQLTGITASDGSVIEGNTVGRSGSVGIDASEASFINNNAVVDSGEGGIVVGAGSVIEENTVGSSGGVGINASEGSVINNNAVRDSDEGGIVAGVGSVIRGNAVVGNGTDLSHDGIHCSLGCRVKDNTLRSNTGFGLRFNSNSSGYSGNTIGSNGAGTVSLGRDTGANVCGTSISCP